MAPTWIVRQDAGVSVSIDEVLGRPRRRAALSTPAGRPDTGVDLVTAHRSSDTFTAIQCPPHEYSAQGTFRVYAGAAAANAPRTRVAADER